MSGEKTEKATPKKLKESRAEGQVARTPDLGAWLMVLAATVLVPPAASSVSSVVIDLFMLANATIVDPDPTRSVALLSKGLKEGAWALVPMGAVGLLIAVVGTAAQGGLHIASKKLKPSFKPLNLLQGVKRLVGVMTWWEALKILVKTLGLALVLWMVIRGLLPKLVGSVETPLMTTLTTTAGGILTLVRFSVLVGCVMAVGDYLMKVRETNKQTKMSKEDVKQEFKQAEGDQHMKGARRTKALSMSRNRMMSDVPSADVVLVNPTHVAVALRYRPGFGAPTVVAKGKGAVAAAIRARAEEARVPLVQDVPLARALHAACDIGQEIPSELYSAVAQVLAFVMGLRARGVAAGTHAAPTRAAAV
ncbi:MAG TPA: EscU/YscU/HrcU family type III secretion system export apparatus switch protein [Actinomycetales bacterium]